MVSQPAFICSKLTIGTLDQGVFIVNFEHISHLALVFLLFNRDLNRGCLVYMFSLRFSGSKSLINLRRQFRVHKVFRTHVFTGFAVFSFSV